MGSSNRPRALLFDIGGVCVVSPFQAILDYERAHGIPAGYVNFAIARSGPHGAWALLECGLVPLDAAFFAHWQADLRSPAAWRAHHHQLHPEKPKDEGANEDAVPPVPVIDGEALFWLMMRISAAPDPWMYPALGRLRRSRRFLLGALSNTVQFPPGIRDDRGEVFDEGWTPVSASLSTTSAAADSLKSEGSPALNETVQTGTQNGDELGTASLHSLFDAFVSSAHVGLRKPDPAIYRLALARLSDVATERGEPPLRPDEVLFLDDIGANLKPAKAMGMRTLKVELGRTDKAVRELEKVTGLSLLEEVEGDQAKAKL